MSELILGFIIGWAAAASIIGFGGIFLAKFADSELSQAKHDLERATANHAADLNPAPQADPASSYSPKADSVEGVSAKPAVAGPDVFTHEPCGHPWPGPGPVPAKFMCKCGTQVYRSYEDYCWD